MFHVFFFTVQEGKAFCKSASANLKTSILNWINQSIYCGVILERATDTATSPSSVKILLNYFSTRKTCTIVYEINHSIFKFSNFRSLAKRRKFENRVVYSIDYSSVKPGGFNDCATEASPKKSWNNAYKAIWHSSTLRIAGIRMALIFISVVISLNYGSDTCLF